MEAPDPSEASAPFVAPTIGMPFSPCVTSLASLEPDKMSLYCISRPAMPLPSTSMEPITCVPVSSLG